VHGIPERRLLDVAPRVLGEDDGTLHLLRPILSSASRHGIARSGWSL
jgi:hypothetical protein